MPIRKFSTVIWDWNGTLINDLGLCVQLVSDALAPRGLGPVTIEQYRAAYQHPIKDMYTELGAELTDEEFRELTVSFLDEYEKGRAHCELHDAAHDVLRVLKEMQKRQVILSAHRHDLVLNAIEDFQIEEFFEEVSGLELGGGHGKTANGHRLIELLGVKPSDVLLVGDSFHDHEVAESLGIECHLVAQGADAREKLDRSGRQVFNTLREWAVASGIAV